MSDVSSPLISVLAGMIASVWTGPFGAGDIPEPKQDIIPPPSPAWQIDILDQEGQRMVTSFSPSPGGLSVSEYPENFINAVIAAEDSRFGSHPGADIVGMAAAAVDTLRGNLRGGSGIAQQLIKIRSLGPEQTLDRKAEELVMALRLRRDVGDQEILRAYLASAWFGRGMTGATHAARVWFGKDWRDLSLAENASIAALLKGPARFDLEDNPERNKDRRNAIIRRMREMGMVSQDEADKAVREEISAIPPETAMSSAAADPWQVSAAKRALEGVMTASGEPGVLSERSVTATFSRAWQDALYAAVGAGPEGNREIAMVAMEIPSGRILAVIGGKDYEKSAYDRTAALRQPGSAAKPLFFLGALEFGMTPWSLVRNDPDRFSGAGWRPSNYDGSVTAPAPLYQGLEASSNLMTLNMAADAGFENVYNIAELSGAWPTGAIDRVAPSVLGASVTSVVRLNAGIAGILNGGVTVPPLFLEGEPSAAPAIFASQASSSFVTDMMAGVMDRGTARTVGREAKVRIVGKTGTSQNVRDAWFVGGTPSVAITAWIGRDDDKGLGGGTGATLAAPYVIRAFNAAYEAGLIDENGLTENAYPRVRWPAAPLPSDPSQMTPGLPDMGPMIGVAAVDGMMIDLQEILAVPQDGGYFDEVDANADLLPR